MKYFIITGLLLFCSSLLAQQSDDCERAWIEFSSGQFEAALTSIEECISGDTVNYRRLFIKGRILENLYRYSDAINVQQEAHQLNPDGMEAKAALAALYLISGQPYKSTHFYELLANAEPEIDRWKINWATALIAAGKHQEALEQLQIVEQNDTTNWVVYKNMGDCYFRLDKLMQAFHNYYIALKLYPHNRNLYGMLTRILVTNNQIEGAIEVGNEAVEIDSTNVEAWRNLGVAYYKAGNTRPAYQALEKALSLGDSSLTTVSHYGVINYQLGRNIGNILYFREAEKYLEKARELNPDDIVTINYLASTYGYTEKAQKGLDILDELDVMIANFDSIGMKANIERGHLLRRLGRNNEAANAFIAATKDFPKDITNFYQVGICYDRAGNKRLAIEWYSRYLEKIDPQWATKRWSEAQLKEHEFIEITMNRINTLRTDLFFEE